MATAQREASTGSSTVQVGPPKTAFQIVVGLATHGAKEILAEDPEALKNLWSVVKDADPDKCLKGLLVGGTFVAATSLVGMGMRKLWSWLTIESVSNGSAIYHVSVAATRVDELKGIVDSGEMKRRLGEILKDPKKFLDDLRLKQNDIKKALDALPEELTISSLELREESKPEVVCDGQSNSKATGRKSAGANVKIKNLTAEGDMHLYGKRNYIDKREGDAARLPQLELPKSLQSPMSTEDDGKTEHSLENMRARGEVYLGNENVLFDERKGGRDKVLVRVIGGDLKKTFKMECENTDLVFDVLAALKEETGKDHKLRIKKTKKELEEDDTLAAAGVTNDTVLEAM